MAVIYRLGLNDGPEMKITVFSSDYTDARLIKRMRAFSDIGWETLCASFRRERYNRGYVPEWKNIYLGKIEDRKYLRRVFVLLRAVAKLLREGRNIGSSQVFYAINLDQLLLALFIRVVCAKKVVIVYEVADIQGAFMRKNAFGSFLRFVERQAMRWIDLMVTTSPGFINNYFQPIQRYHGECFLLENVVYPVPSSCSNGQAGENGSENKETWVVGFFGLLKCRRSWQLIKEIASALPSKVSFKLGGYPYPADIDYADFYKTVDNFDNITYVGEYAHPHDLEKIYSGVDFVWCFDFSNDEYNSVWCLANRLYEGGYFEIPLLASKNYEAGRFVEKYGIGWTFGEPYAEELSKFFARLTRAQYRLVKEKYRSIDKQVFAGDQQHRALCARMEALYEAL